MTLVKCLETSFFGVVNIAPRLLGLGVAAAEGIDTEEYGVQVCEEQSPFALVTRMDAKLLTKIR